MNIVKTTLLSIPASCYICAMRPLLLACLTVLTMAAAELPYVATGRIRMFKLLPDGSRELVSTSQTIDARDASGNRYRKQSNGARESITLWLKASGELYLIHPARQSKQLLGTQPHAPGVLPDVKASGSDSINGIPCLRLTRDNSFTCISQEYGGLTLHSESSLPIDSQPYLTIIELTGLRHGEVPPPSWFQLP